MSEYGFILPEEKIAAVLRAAQADLRAAYADADRIDDLLSRMFFNLTDDQVAQIKQWFWENKDVRIIFGYPLQTQEYPSYNIIIGGEQVSQEYVGNIVNVQQLETGETVLVDSQRWSSNISVVAGADNGDLTRWLYHFAKFALAAARRELQTTMFPHGVKFSGEDLRPLEIPHSGRIIFRKTLTLGVEYDQNDTDKFDVADLTNVATDATTERA